MSLGLLGLGYAGIGVVIAIGALVLRRRISAGDVVFLTVLWPLAAPLMFSGHRDEQDPGAAQLISALARAQASPLASVLPDAETARVLASRLREAGGRLADLDQVLARPDFDVGEDRADRDGTDGSEGERRGASGELGPGEGRGMRGDRDQGHDDLLLR